MTKFQVVVVDDEPLAREVAVSILRRDPEVASVVECGDGVRARQTIEDSRPDIVFLDVEMPGLDGMQLAEHFQSGGPVVGSSRHSVDMRWMRSIWLLPITCSSHVRTSGSSRRSDVRSVACASAVLVNWRIRWRAWLPNFSSGAG